MLNKTLIALMFVLFAGVALGQTNVEKVKKLYDQGKLSEAVKYVEEASNEAKRDADFQILCGDIYFELEDLEGAERCYRKAQKRDSDHLQMLMKLGRVLHLQKKTKEAFELLDEAIDEGDDKIEPYLEYAAAHIRDKNIGDAQTMINKAKKINDEDARVFLTSGDMYFAQGIYELAKKDYLEALKYDISNIEARSNLATSYYWLANREADADLRNEYFALCLKEWQNITKYDPNYAKSFFEQGKILFWANRPKDAAPKLNRFVALRPNHKLGRWYLAQSLQSIGRCDSASSHLRWVSENIDSVKVKSRLLLAQCYFKNKEYSDAVGAYEKIISDTTLGLKDMKMYGNASLLLGDTAKAVEIWDKTIEMKPDASCGLMMMLGQLSYMKKDYLRAAHYFELKLNTEGCSDAKDGKANSLLGQSYLFAANQKELDDSLKLERLSSAEIYLKKAIELDSTNFRAQVYLGDVFAGGGDKQSAINLYAKIIESASVDKVKYKSNLRQAFAKISGLYLKQKQLDKVIEYGTLWAEFQPESEYGSLYVAIAYHNKYAAGQDDADFNKACKWYRKVLEINPNNKSARKSLNDLGC